MKLALMCRNADLYSHKRIVEAAEARGHEIDVVDHLRCYINITSLKPTVRYRGEDLPHFDAVIPRIGASVTFYGTAVLRQLEMMGVYPVNESVAISRSRDKLRSLQLLARRGIGLPVTVFAHRTSRADEILEMIGGAPVIIKLLEGTQGIGVVLGKPRKAPSRSSRPLAASTPTSSCRNSSRKRAERIFGASFSATRWSPP